MILSIIVNEFTEEQKLDAFANREITVSGKVEGMFFQDGAIHKAFEKVEMFENLIAMGLIDQEALNEMGYKE